MFTHNTLTGFNARPLYWQDIVSPVTLNSNGGGTPNCTWRQIFNTSILTVRNLSAVRVSFEAPTSETFVVTGAYIGLQALSGDSYDFATTPTQLKFGGSTSFSLPASQTIVSDVADFSLPNGYGLIVSFQQTSNFVRYSNPGLSGHSYAFKVALDASTVDATGYSIFSPNTISVTRIEAY